MNSFYVRHSIRSSRALLYFTQRHQYTALKIAACALAMLGTYQQIQAATANNWNINSGGSWNVGANWSTGNIPTIAEDAVIGPIATSVSSPASIATNSNQTAFGLTLDPAPGKSIRLNPGISEGGRLTLLSTDTAPDGVSKFFTINTASGIENQINAPIVLGGAGKGAFTAQINSFDPEFAIKGGISESVASWGVRINGNNQGIVSYANTSNMPNTYTGDTTIAPGGILRVDFNNAIPNGPNRGNVVLEGNGQLQFLNAIAQGINGLNSTSSTAVITNIPGNNGVKFTVGNLNAAGTFAGSINNPTGAGLFDIVKTGSGIQKLTGANSYRGTTIVSGGTLLVNGTHNSAGNYTTATGATLGGTGSINLAGDTSVTVNAGSLAPGDGGPGVLNIGGTLNMSSVGTLKLEIGGAFPGNGSIFYDQLNMTRPTATINASFAHVSAFLVNGFKPKLTDCFYILTRADSAPFGATQPFDAYPEGATINLGSDFTGKVTYKANWTGTQATSTPSGGNDMAIVIVPEPGSAALLSLGLLCIGATSVRKPVSRSEQDEHGTS
jgi:autotransporter-associated beta strand protein